MIVYSKRISTDSISLAAFGVEEFTSRIRLQNEICTFLMTSLQSVTHICEPYSNIGSTILSNRSNIVYLKTGIHIWNYTYTTNVMPSQLVKQSFFWIESILV